MSNRERTFVSVRRRLKTDPLPPVTADSILTALMQSIGSSNATGRGGSGLPIPQLLQLIASYAAPFLSSKRLIPFDDSEIAITPVLNIRCAMSDEWLLAGSSSKGTFYKFSYLSGMCRYRYRHCIRTRCRLPLGIASLPLLHVLFSWLFGR